jgi:hypothetical protein
MGCNRRILAVLGSLTLILLAAPAAAAAADAAVTASSHAAQNVQAAAPAAAKATKECGPTTAAPIWSTGLACLGRGTHNKSGWGTLQLLANITPFRVWLHGKANDKGWSVCFSPNSTWSIRGEAEHPGSIQVTTNPQVCTSFPPNADKFQCGENIGGNTSTYFDAAGKLFSGAFRCYADPAGQTHTHPFSGRTWLIYDSGIRAWLHKNANGTGWSDCFRDGIYKIGGTRDATPGNVQFTTVNAPCP